MSTLIQYLLITHVVAGSVSLVVAPAALFVSKGGRAHRVLGRTFFWTMTWIFLSALVLSIYRFNPFLLMIAVFSYYNVVTGYRAIYQKQLHLRKGVMWYDWLASIISLLFNAGFVIWGIRAASSGTNGFTAYLAIFFGSGGLVLTVASIRKYLFPPADKYRWFYDHVGYMIGGFIASLTAFSANVITFIPGMWQWLWPSLVLVPVIFYVNAYYRRKLKNGARLAELVELKR
jgi:hypothetical protein